MAGVRRSPYDGEIVRLALPALGALAAEPLYLLVDTAIVGHLGTPQLAALALAATVLSNLVALCIFLTYGTTARVTRLHGAGHDADAAALGPQAFWLALAAGVALAAVVAALAEPARRTRSAATAMSRTWRRATCGSPPSACRWRSSRSRARAGCAGSSDLRTPLVIVASANVVNVVLELLFVYGFDWGLDGSAWGTVLAQLGMGAAFATVLLRAFAWPDLARIRSLVSIGAQLVVRTAALLGCFVLATAVCAHIGAATVAAHQIAFQLFGFLALVLDAIAIAGQVIVGRALGAGQADEAFAAARRMLELSLAAGLVIGGVFLALSDVVPRLFTSDPDVLDQAHELWPLFCALWPVAAVVFALDGILIGAGDTRYLAAAMIVAFVVFLPLVLSVDTVAGVWAALDVLMLARLATLGGRFARGRWALVGVQA